MGKTKLTGERLWAIWYSPISRKKPDKKTICPLVIILLDYYTDDKSEEEMTMSEFTANTFRKRFMLQDLIEKWRAK